MCSLLLKQLYELDIFALLVFKDLFEQGQANLTAKALHVSPPKVSRCLTALRQTFNDELFYRRQQGLKPTPLAESLYEPVCQFIHSVSQIEQSAQNSHRSDSQSYRDLHLAIDAELLIPFARLLGHDPFFDRHRIHLHKWDETSAEKIHTGVLDIAITSNLISQQLLQQQSIMARTEIAVIARDLHPIWPHLTELTLEQLCEYPFIDFESDPFNLASPLQLFCQQAGIELTSNFIFNNREEWLSHLLTSTAFSLSSHTHAAEINQIEGLKAALLTPQQYSSLINVLPRQEYRIIEQTLEHRRYNQQQKEAVIDVFEKVFTFARQQFVEQREVNEQ